MRRGIVLYTMQNIVAVLSISSALYACLEQNFSIPVVGLMDVSDDF